MLNPVALVVRLAIAGVESGVRLEEKADIATAIYSDFPFSPSGLALSAGSVLCPVRADAALMGDASGVMGRGSGKSRVPPGTGVNARG